MIVTSSKWQVTKGSSFGLLLGLAYYLLLATCYSAQARGLTINVEKLEKNIRRDSVANEDELKTAVARLAGDPDDVKFRNTKLHKGAADFPVLCGEVNIMDHAAGGGWQRFVHPGEPVLEEDGDSFQRAWEKHCE